MFGLPITLLGSCPEHLFSSCCQGRIKQVATRTKQYTIYAQDTYYGFEVVNSRVAYIACPFIIDVGL